MALALGLIGLSAGAGNVQPIPAPSTQTGRALVFLSPLVGKEAQDAVRRPLLGDETLPLPALSRVRGTAVVRLSVKEPFGGFPAYVELYPGPPHLTFRCSAAWHKANKDAPEDKSLLDCQANVVLAHTGDGNVLEEFSGTVPVKPGGELHAVWTWSGTQHRLFLNGKPVASYAAQSPFPRGWNERLRFLANADASFLSKAAVQEIAVYDFPMAETDVVKDSAQKDDRPYLPKKVTGPALTAEFAPGEQRAYLSLDTGLRLAGRVTGSAVEISGPPGWTSPQPTTVPVGADGFGELLLEFPKPRPGTYHVRARFLNTDGQELGAAASDSWELPSTEWLGNTLGITDKIQPPWTPIARDGATLKVWGRELRLGGGFGLPQQIVSQGRDWLAKPVTLGITIGGKAVSLAQPTVEILENLPHVARWSGSATAGDVKVSVSGRLEYDGMTLLRLRLEPSAPGRAVKLDALRLDTVMPRERALLLNTCTDQGYWWHPYRSWVPDKPGPVLNNLQQKPGKTSFLFFTLFSDQETGLEWFADNLGGWQVDMGRPVQEIVREADGTVRLACHLANRPFELKEPLEIVFGYDATPVKPLPPDWRTAYVHYGQLAGVQSDLALWWSWPDDAGKQARQGTFNLCPRDPEGYRKAVVEPKKGLIKVAPFTNQHVLDAHNEQENAILNRVLASECGGVGWVAMPTRGVRDYWAWSIDRWIQRGGIGALYMDEANDQTVSAGLLRGSGYLLPDGTHGYGHNTLGMREQIKRIRQLFINNGQRPVVWIPVYGHIIPHAHAFVDIVSEGEAYMFEKPDAPDWIDQWGAGLLERKGGPGAEGGSWLRSIGAAQKFGFIPIFLDYIKFYNHPKYDAAVRGHVGLLALMDIIPINSSQGWFFKATADFGLTSPETAFHSCFEQREILAARADVQVSYYRRAGRVLAIVTNLGKEPYEGPITIDWKTLGLTAERSSVVRIDGKEPGQNRTELLNEPMTPEKDGTLRLAVPAHDFRMVRLEPTGP